MKEFDLLPVKELRDIAHIGETTVACNGVNSHPDCSEIAAAVRNAWTAALLSGAGDELLTRYFTYHARILNKVMSSLKVDDHTLIILYWELHDYYHMYVASSVRVSISYFRHILPRLETTHNSFLPVLNDPAFDRALREILLTFYDGQVQFGLSGVMTWKGLIYLGKWLDGLSALLQLNPYHNIDEEVADVLVALNFNDLRYFAWLQERLQRQLDKTNLQDRLTLLHELSSKYQPETEAETQAYDDQWPDILRMISTWLKEMTITCRENVKLEPSFDKPNLSRVFLNLSAAHLAYVLRLFYEEGIHGEASLTDLFRFITSHYRTKKQPAISMGSFSNKYYNVTQVTAAVVRDILQKMISRINRTHFPV
jgi:hypothetical protein